MSDQHITYFKVENFKRFRSFEMDNIGQFNLLVGDNNVGKTSVLESLLVDSRHKVFFNSLRYVLLTIKRFDKITQGNFLDFYLNNREPKSPNILKCEIRTKANGYNLFELKMGEFKQSYLWRDGNEFLDISYIFSEVNTENEYQGLDLTIPFIPYGFSYDHRLTKYYSNHIQLSTSRKDYFINGLRQIIPKIRNIEVNAGFSSDPVLLISQEDNDAVLPLATFGDGVLKLFRLLIAIIVHRGKRLMIDEVETGIHYSRMKEFWKVILSAAKENDVQLFCTTHSRECMESYSTALNELHYNDEGRVIRLAETPKGIKAYTMQFEEFEKAILADSEIR
jgi:AAA15 family ATPase/GTPase